MNSIEQAKEKLFNDIAYFNCFHWNSNHSPEKDLKFHQGDNEIYFRESKGLKDFNLDYIMSEEYVAPDKAEDWFKPDFDRGEILFTADIAIFHKDSIKYIIEVVDEIYLNTEKLKIINNFFDGLNYYQVKATDILNCENIQNPNFLIYQQLDSLDEMIKVINGRMTDKDIFIQTEIQISSDNYCD